MAVAPHEIVASKGEAVGRIAGFSHLVMIARDMDATVRFYRDILGLKVFATSGEEAMKLRDAQDAQDASFGGTKHKRPFTRQYFFELPNGEAFGFYEIADAPDGRETTPVGHWYWPGGEDMPPVRPHKLDHLAFHVPTKDDVEFFMKRLTDYGIDFMGPFTPRAGSPTRFTYRIYVWDPNGIPLEIATLVDYEVDPSTFLQDTKPVPALLEG